MYSKKISLILKRLKKYHSVYERYKDFVSEQKNLNFINRRHKFPLEFLDCIKDLMDKKYFNQCLHLSLVTGFYGGNNKIISKLLKKSIKKYIMYYKNDYKIYKNLPNIITVYRGCLKKGRWRFYWSIDKSTAEFMGTRKTKNGYLYEAKIKKKDVYFYTNYRGEKEVVLNPNELFNRKKRIKLD